MKKEIVVIILVVLMFSIDGLCQKGPGRYFGQPILTDSLSTLFIPVQYNEDFLSSNKITLGGDYYANIVAYNYSTDSYKRLFEKDSFIESFITSNNNYYGYGIRGNEKAKNISANWVFLLVKNKDTNNNGRIDERDP